MRVWNILGPTCQCSTVKLSNCVRVGGWGGGWYRFGMKRVSTVQPQTPCHAMHVHLAGNCTLSVIASDTDTYIAPWCIKVSLLQCMQASVCLSACLHHDHQKTFATFETILGRTFPSRTCKEWCRQSVSYNSSTFVLPRFISCGF